MNERPFTPHAVILGARLATAANPPAPLEVGCAHVALNVKKVLLALPASLAPLLVGVSIAEAELRLCGAINEALQQLHVDPSGDLTGQGRRSEAS
jgi:hypothetical protein